MNQREKEEYLREYAILKSKGKPFFPYAVAKDSAMAVIVMLAIILMSNSANAEGIFPELLERLIANTYTPVEWEGYVPYDREPPPSR